MNKCQGKKLLFGALTGVIVGMHGAVTHAVVPAPSDDPIAITLSLLAVDPSTQASDFTTKSNLLFATLSKSDKIPKALLSTRILFGEGMRKSNGVAFVALSQEMAKRVKENLLLLPRDTESNQLAAFVTSFELIETFGNLSAHRDAIAFYKKNVAPYEASYKGLPLFGEMIGYMLGSYYAVGRGDYAEALAKRLLNDPAVAPVERAAIAVGLANNLISAERVTDALTYYNLAITIAPTAPITAQAYYWSALKVIAGRTGTAPVPQALDLSAKGVVALGTPLLAWERELETRLTVIQSNGTNLPSSMAADLALLKK